MPFSKTDISGLLLFHPKVFEDSRGYFFESYNKETFAAEGLINNWVQDNESYSGFGVIRGLHFQNPPKAQAKLIRVLEGKIYDVAVDIRKGSPTFGKWFGVELSSENKLQLLIPKGFAHGFSVLSETAKVLYKCDNLYDKNAEGGIMYNDADLNIDWKIPFDKSIISGKDLNHPSLKVCNTQFIFEG
ncbi:MAG: dTDP-4-dehydrorhamnose 3,5-epimerase [Chitinophagaceae bacterium]|nr:dTDP-4-dehydrorhamnose 3,5-epimerase [Chitinophagaceae bacterium]